MTSAYNHSSLPLRGFAVPALDRFRLRTATVFATLTFMWLINPIAYAQPSAEEGWVNLMDMALWKTPHGTWFTAQDAKLVPDNPKMLAAVTNAAPMANSPVWINGPKGRTNNLTTLDKFGDVEIELEFMVPKGSNSGIKLHGHYEIQIFDSYGSKSLEGKDNGGVYPRAELLPRYHHLDKGIAPKTNASQPPGTWQTMTIRFRAPRFGADGKKIANACFEKVVLNGKIIHDQQEVTTPTGHAYVLPEMTTGPILIQADHGPVAIRGLRVRPLPNIQ